MSDFITKELKELNYMKKRPEKVYFKGNLELLEKRKIAIVGSRKPIAYTKQFTHQLAANVIYKNKLKYTRTNLNGVVI